MSVVPVQNPEVSMELRLERMRLQEALCARDTVAQRLAEACTFVRQKNNTIEQLLAERGELLKRFSVRAPGELDVVAGETTMGTVIGTVQEDTRRTSEESAASDGELQYYLLEQHMSGATSHGLLASAVESDPSSVALLRDMANKMEIPMSPNMSGPGWVESQNFSQFMNDHLAKLTLQDSETSDFKVASSATDLAQQVASRNAILSALPLPPDIPADALRPIVIPAPYTLHEFLGTTPAQSTTSWCPEREEHGYFLSPVFKCSTNPRVSAAHRWTVVDLATKLNKPTECFYNRDGKWYYAGTYKAFRLDDLSTQEWETLLAETTQALIKETLAGRKNTTPQNVYESGQLYAVGALKVACIGLQCIGFNNTLYRTILEHAAKCAQTGKWRNSSTVASPPALWTAATSTLLPSAASMAAGVAPPSTGGNVLVGTYCSEGGSTIEDIIGETASKV
ncbi:hypothetical protein BKA93DRAFT_725211 [Sparassis latifolia]